MCSSCGPEYPNEARAAVNTEAAVPARPEPAVMRATRRLSSNIDALKEEVEALVMTIGPILTPVNETEPGDKVGHDTPGGESDLSNWIRSQTEEISRLVDILNATRQRVEL